ncbi:hypothetical protein DL768_004181 [Monosporascus sp. mg162]|nr:hypothetical protein DL768_004181 [Monosporascus sp. mg162]
MAKKRKATGGAAQPKGPREYDSADARIGPVNTFEDIADDQEKYFLEQDQILFDGGRKSKKQRRLEEEEEFLEESDEEVLDYDDEDSEHQDDDDEGDLSRKPKWDGKNKTDGYLSDAERGGEEEGDSSWWGASRKEYYNNDEIENEDDAFEEEREALRLQKKKLARLEEEDFIFNEDEWRGPEVVEADQEEVVTEVLKDVEITPDMSSEERYRLLQKMYPELDYLADELLRLQPLLVTLQKQAEGQHHKSLEVIKYRILGSYVAALAMYFATLSSPARDSNGEARALNPAELRDHEVMGTLLECRDAWKKVENLETTKNLRAAESIPSPPEEGAIAAGQVEVAPKTSQKPNKDPAAKRAKAKAERQAKAIEESLADLDALITTKKKSKRKSDIETAVQDGNSDFGEEEVLDARIAAEKAARKKSLRFYTSQIVQKANRRTDAGRDAGGDMDIPYRERLKDRQARLMAEAEQRGKKDSKHGADLGDASDEEDAQVANAMRDDEDEYYDMVSARKKGQKAAKSAALAEAKKGDRVVEVEEVGEDGKRRITYAIQKNKGLTPNKTRKQDKNNPRVKKRKRYAEKTKKLKSMKPVYQGGEGKGGYKGELTGIKPGLIKSVRL